MTTRTRLLPTLAAVAVLLSACSHYEGVFHDVLVVRDLSKVAGCRFLGTVRPPSAGAGLRSADVYGEYIEELRRRTARLGGTHLYLLNEAAGWGAADAVGTAYRCIV